MCSSDLWVGYEPPREGEARYLHSCSLVGRKMYVWGGKGRTGLVRQMDIYDFDTETWTTGVADGIARYAHVAIPAGELIYYFGGRGIDSDEDGSDDYLDSLEIYNTVKNLWIQGPSLGIPLESAAASFVRDRIYVYGGTRNGDFFNNELYIYNIGSGIWRKGLSGGLSRRNSRGVAFNNKLYFHGGFNGEIVDQLDWFEIPGP